MSEQHGHDAIADGFIRGFAAMRETEAACLAAVDGARREPAPAATDFGWLLRASREGEARERASRGYAALRASGGVAWVDP